MSLCVHVNGLNVLSFTGCSLSCRVLSYLYVSIYHLYVCMYVCMHMCVRCVFLCCRISTATLFGHDHQRELDKSLQQLNLTVDEVRACVASERSVQEGWWKLVL